MYQFFRYSILIVLICSMSLASSSNHSDCSAHTSCRSCILSNCYWCVGENRCTSNSEYHCPYSIIPVGLSADVCPSIIQQVPKPTIGDLSQILILAGTNKSIQVEVNIAGQLMTQSKLVCQFNFENSVIKVNAQLIGNIIHCDSLEFDYPQTGVGTANATFSVLWGESIPLENPNNVRVTIYRCTDMASNCTSCMDVLGRYLCGWCFSTNQCVLNSQCIDGSGSWIYDYDTCSTPYISDFSPKLGPKEGGTNVTIQGFNLDTAFRETSGHITVNGIPCEPYKSLIEPHKIVCLVNKTAPNKRKSRPGPVILKTDEDTESKSKQNFTFVNPEIQDIFPKYGSLSGGTELSIRGTNLDAGVVIEVSISKLPCQIIFINSTEIKCITSASNKPLDGNVTVTFDQVTRSHKELFIYSNCMAYTSCMSCVASSINCDWCLNGHFCKHDEAANCPKDHLVIGVNVDDVGGQFKKGPGFCPKINGTTDGSSEILVPAGTQKKINVKTANSWVFIAMERFQCRFNIEGRVTSVYATLLGNAVYCNAMEFAYTQSSPNTTAMLDVLWGGTRSLDNPTDVRVLVYKCKEMAKSRNECSTVEAKYNCGWCQSTNSCEFKDHCKSM